MRKLNLIVIMLLPFVIIMSCKEEGPEGPQGEQGLQGEQGEQGPQGPQGIAGNANVRQYTFASHDFSVSASTTLQVTTTADTMNTSAWFIYLVRASGNVYPMPGSGLNGSSDYRVYWAHSLGKVAFTISKASGAGEPYESIRIIRIYANTVVPGGRIKDLLPDDIDFNDYEAVCRYYDLPG